MARAAAVYCRISQDDGRALGVQRQEADCRALCEGRGWPVARVFTDNDVSAYSGKRRPAYQAMVTSIREGEVDAVVVWHLDRLIRRPIELEEFFDICDAAGVKDMATVTGDIDLSTHDGRFMARILGAAARKESDDKSRRTRRKHLELAQAGRPAGAGRPFGFEEDRVTLRPSEVLLIQEAAERVLAGESVRSICLDWMARGVAGVRAPVVRPTRLHRVLISRRIAGLRTLRDEVEAPAVWPPIISPETSDRLRAVLLDPSRARVATWNARSHLLTGWLRCGRCETALVARRHRNRARSYVCASGPDRRGCGGLRILADPTEDVVMERVYWRLRSPQLLSAVNHDDLDMSVLLDAVGAEEEALAGLARDHYAARIIGRAEFIAARDAIQIRLDTARHALSDAETRRSRSEWIGRPEELRAAWKTMNLGQRRGVLGSMIETIVIAPASAPAAGRFDPDRIRVRWLH